MRRKLTIIALAAMMLAAGEPALAQSPNIPKIQLQVQPKLRIQPKINRPPVIRPMIPLSQAQRNIQMVLPSAKVLKIGPLPSGDIIATIRIEDKVRKIRVDGETGEVQN
jgi:hypothetical protein